MEIPRNSLKKYISARQNLLDDLEVSTSNRDPLSELSEVIAAVKLNAKKVGNRVNKGYDLIGPYGDKIEVKYLANRHINGKLDWKNWHDINFDNKIRDKYALVVFIDLKPTAMFVFSRDTIRDVCLKLGKTHQFQECMLSFTKTDYERLLSNPTEFNVLGVTVFDNLV